MATIRVAAEAAAVAAEAVRAVVTARAATAVTVAAREEIAAEAAGQWRLEKKKIKKNKK